MIAAVCNISDIQEQLEAPASYTILNIAMSLYGYKVHTNSLKFMYAKLPAHYDAMATI